MIKIKTLQVRMTRKDVFQLCTLILFISALIAEPVPVFAAEKTSPSSRSKVIDFEGDVIEGMNKQPWDSLSQVVDQDKKRRNHHLYRKRKGFRTETQETLREVRFAQ